MTQRKSDHKLVELRRAKGWTQEHLAEVAGVSHRTVQRAERGRAALDTLQALAQALGVDVAELVQPPPEEPEGGMRTASQPEVDATRHALLRVTSGKILADLVGGANAYHFDHGDLTTGDVEVVGGFLQSLQDWGDIWSDFGPLDRARATASLSVELAEVEMQGFWVFGERKKRRMRLGDGAVDLWSVAAIVVLRHDDASIATWDPSLAASEDRRRG